MYYDNIRNDRIEYAFTNRRIKKDYKDMNDFTNQGIKHLLDILEIRETLDQDKRFRFFIPYKTEKKCYSKEVEVFEKYIPKIQKYVNQEHFNSIEDFVETAIIEEVGIVQTKNSYGVHGMAIALPIDCVPDLNTQEKNIVRKSLNLPPLGEPVK